jgi:glycosyltransferase involved in cell wall biosynthesis
VDEFFSPASGSDHGEATRTRFAAGHRYVLHLGTIEPRKRIPDLVSAWETVHGGVDDPPHLVIAGGEGWDTVPIVDRIRRSPLHDKIHLPGYVDRSDALQLLRHAAVFVLASEAEGFGLPLAEAISCGVPCVASDIPSLREAGGRAALFTPPRQPDALARAITEALDPTTAADLRSRASTHSDSLRWGPVVDRWNRLLQAVVEQSASFAPL